MRIIHRPTKQSDRAEICTITRTDGDVLRDIGYIALIAPGGATEAQ
ncbi:hypothetical protein [Thalassospira sp. UBA4513]|nr:hypothetical protein [Thalassospira sp. UBA4513]|tara:strand:+ start:313 stop:450 length:138 start_codon:yes stop_codon:yes gene_type:complete